MVPKIAKRTPKGTIFGQDCAQDRRGESQGDHSWAKMVPKIAKRRPKGTILGARLGQRSSAKLFQAKVAKSVRVLFKTRI